MVSQLDQHVWCLIWGHQYIVLGQLAMYVGLSKPTIVKQSPSILSSRDDLQSLGLLQVVQTVVDDLELEASENYLPCSFLILW